MTYPCPDCALECPLKPGDTFTCRDCQKEFRVEWVLELAGGEIRWVNRSTVKEINGGV